MTRHVYRFGGGQADGHADLRDLLGGKGANLAEMNGLGLPVPPGFTITTAVCSHCQAHDGSYPEGLEQEVERALESVEAMTDTGFGDPVRPLLVSVRSGAAASMPGMLDTVLNLGLNDATREGLAASSGDARFAADSHRRFIQMYGNVVLGISHRMFEDVLDEVKFSKGVELDTDLSAGDWLAVIERYRALVLEQSGTSFPDDPRAQLWGAVGAVFRSWGNARAVTYRELHGLDHAGGTAVNVQAMVFGNMGEDSCTGVAFTRDPSTGEASYYGEFLPNAQGEDVVAGIRTPRPLTAASGVDAEAPPMEVAMPAVYAELTAAFTRLETHYRDMQDIEFTVQKGKLWILQTRNGKRSTKAALRIAVDLANQGVISRAEAIRRIEPERLDQLLHPTLDPTAHTRVIVRGLPASPGAASGIAVFSADAAERRGSGGEDVILVRSETSPEDIHGMHAARGILTNRGGQTSHAAVVARGMGRPCVVGAGELVISHATRSAKALSCSFAEGDLITIDGSTGAVMLGKVPTIDPELPDAFHELMGWADGIRKLRIRANAETPADAETARRFGAEGIGLCRTEHMFFDGERILAMRQMIMAENTEERRAALARIAPMQRQDFVELFRIMAGWPVTIRLLDPPLHEFLPANMDELDEVAARAGLDAEALRRRATELAEANPMLGHRGARLGISYPEIYDMQVQAIFEALHETVDAPVELEIMLPLVFSRAEVNVLRSRITHVAEAVTAATGWTPSYTVGTMIELPRAALAAGSIAESAEFFSFGTNDLTQTTFGISRDDAGRFLARYLDAGVFAVDPFVSLDAEGVGELIQIAAERGRATRPGLKLGICGEHGGDPASVAHCHVWGLDYVSCSPYRVPIARLAAARAAVASGAGCADATD